MQLKANFFLYFLIFLTLLTEGCGYLGNSLKAPPSSTVLVSEHSLLAEVLMHLQLDYIDSEKLVPELLLEGALTEFEKMLSSFPMFEKSGNELFLCQKTTLCKDLQK